MNTWQRVMQGTAEGIELAWALIRSGWGDANAWERTIARFEKQDRIKPPPQNAIVFTGSSSFTLWTTLAQDMAPLPVINRGFGGSKIDDVVRYAERIVLPYHPRIVVLFAGTNDISGRQPKTAQEVFRGYKEFIYKVQAALPETSIYYVSITPTPSRWNLWPIADRANQLIKACAESDPRLHFIDLPPAILGPDGRPDRSLYRMDRLHPNLKGYAVWTSVIKPILMDMFLSNQVFPVVAENKKTEKIG